jgi:hypothetical protein
MYFPYLRGKQEEVFAVREAANRIGAKRKVFPVFEPVKEQMGQIVRAAELLCQAGIPHALIENPRVGDLANRHADVSAQIIAPVCALGPVSRPALLIDPRTTDAEIAAFLSRHANRQVVLVHKTSFRDAAVLRDMADRAGNVEYNLFFSPGTSRAYQGVFAAYNNAVVSDAFVRQRRNADYEDYDPEPFTSEHLNFVGDNMAGFGDFATVGSHWSEDGGPARAVALHVTYPVDDGSVWIRHFVSDDTDSIADREGKTLQAIAKATAFAAQMGATLAFSTAVPEWNAAQVSRRAPTLGILKRQSLRHHLELMDSLL